MIERSNMQIRLSPQAALAEKQRLESQGWKVNLSQFGITSQVSNDALFIFNMTRESRIVDVTPAYSRAA